MSGYSARTRGIAGLLLLSLASLYSAAGAQDHAHHHDDGGPGGHGDALGAHVHGRAALTLAQDGPQLLLELDSPAANLVGFEHPPMTAAERKLALEAQATLREASRLFRLSPAAGCRLTAVNIASGLAEVAHGDHADIVATYGFTCAHPQRLDGLEVDLFQLFPATRELTVQYALQHRQGGATVTAAAPTLRF